ncbi:hypothetical protein BD410DRAFT_355672 [Rickenella mellea]|uniref:Uncharacterized protein n=1 Tax=Rickenella mellea TaxID=50990 RepID=A0A4Y7Q0J8_9AGAM|nr:hypothetical protein BD410DRAFT_355672 [Rickenella mellea]
MSAKDLPSELLILIFLECLPSAEFPRPKNREAPVSLTQVCRHWRTVSITFPQLWSAIALGWNSEERDLKALGFWLERSGCLPLSFGITHGIDYACSPRVVEKIRSESSRWKTIHLTASEGCVCSTAFGAAFVIPGNLLMLEDYRIINTPRRRPFDSYERFILLYAPRLSTLHVGGHSLIRIYYPRYTTHHAMRELRLHKIASSDNCLATLRQCPSLQILEFSLPEYIGSIPEDNDMHTVPLLHTLLMTGSCKHAHYVLGHVCLPALLRLSVVPHVKDMAHESSVWSELTQLLRRSGSKLEELRLSCDTENPADVVSVLKSADSLKVFAIGSSVILTHLNKLLPPHGAGRMLCQKLRQFEFHGPLRPCEIEEIAEVFVGRWRYSQTTSPSIAPFKIIIRYAGYIPLSQFFRCEGVQQCIDEGMEIEGMNSGKYWWTSEV